jgi:hypothetical protein
METTPADSLAVATLTPDLPLAARLGGSSLIRDPQLTVTGTGRILHEVYTTLGSAAEKHANRAAHNLGLGPSAVARRIQDYFGDGFEREAKLAGLETQCRKIEKDCGRLMEYALP